MTRVKRSVNAKKKRRKTLELTKGFRGEANSNYKRAKEALTKADTYAYRDRRNRKRPRHVRRRHLYEADLVRLHPLILHQLVDDQVLVAILAGDGEGLAP